MRIDYYQCNDDNKKINKTPNYLGSSTCNVYGTCSMDSPNFIVDSYQGNYCKFDGKYYFINNQVYSNGKWILQCTTDDLYNSAAEINNLLLTAVRNEFISNSNIQDNAIQLTVRQRNIIEPFGSGVPYSSSGKVYLVGIKGE